MIMIIGFITALFINPSDKSRVLYLVTILIFVETGLSFDNAIVNATVLNKLSKKRQKLFIWAGLPIGIFITRLAFPILLVSLTTPLSFVEVFKLAINHPGVYQHTLQANLPTILTFGGSFLIMVFLKFFLIQNHEVHWICGLEKSKIVSILRNYPSYYSIPIVIWVIMFHYTTTHSEAIIISISFLMGIIVHETLNVINLILNNRFNSFTRNQILSLVYLEVLDASFSLDSVIGAFAISMNIFIIMIGLGIGAVLTRSLTIFFIENKTLSKFRYLEHGAHYAIGSLAVAMIIGVYKPIPEWITGIIEVGLIVTALINSIQLNTRKS